jgi:general stress protein 26
MTSNTATQFAELMDKAQAIKFCMLTTLADGNHLRSRPFTTQQTLPDGTAWFYAARESDAVSEINENPEIALIYADTSAGRYLSMSGEA